MPREELERFGASVGVGARQLAIVIPGLDVVGGCPVAKHPLGAVVDPERPLVGVAAAEEDGAGAQDRGASDVEVGFDDEDRSSGRPRGKRGAQAAGPGADDDHVGFRFPPSRGGARRHCPTRS